MLMGKSILTQNSRRKAVFFRRRYIYSLSLSLSISLSLSLSIRRFFFAHPHRFFKLKTIGFSSF